jgi:septal ring factor EnvC (AmiA/AmiB activator)
MEESVVKEFIKHLPPGPSLEELDQQIVSMERKRDLITDENAKLRAQVSDLRLLISRVASEGEVSSARERRELEKQVRILEAALDVVRKDGAHLSRMADFWPGS